MHDMMGMAIFFDAMTKQKQRRQDERAGRRCRRPFRSLWQRLASAVTWLAGRGTGRGKGE